MLGKPLSDRADNFMLTLFARFPHKSAICLAERLTNDTPSGTSSDPNAGNLHTEKLS